MGTGENKAVVRRYFEGGVNAQDPAVGEALVHPGAVVTVTQLVLARVRDGQIVEAWDERDALSLLRQLGALP